MVGTTIWAALVEGKTIFLLFSLPSVFAIGCSILVLLCAGSAIAQRSGGWVESRGLLLLARQIKPLSYFS